MAVILALASAMTYGVSDFLGGVFSRGQRVSAWQIAVAGQCSSAAVTWLAVLAVTGEATREHVLLSALAGLGSGFGTGFLYRGFARGRMGVVAPVSAVGSALVPLAVGLGQGDRPSALAVIGVACAFPAIWLVARPDPQAHGPLLDAEPGAPSGFVDAVLAGLGFGVLFAVLGQIPDDAGFVPLAICQTVSIAAIVVTAMLLREAWVPRSGPAALGLLLGPLGFTATAAFMLATHHGLLSVVSVIAALYPASTVLLARLVLHERIGRGQAAGLAAAAVSVSLVALG
ncbi:MAG: EamA family transporter [Aeromicrobium sp.]|uniref:EamA family transporter n=1 Tax=Aeromicrobium sp. TaxID=1871063 RepID=UPI0039E39781